MRPIHIALAIVINGFIGSIVLADENHSISVGGELITPDFFAGNYVVVGKQPDGGAAYSGSASLKTDGSNIVMHLRIGNEITSAIGQFEVPHPAGEGAVLRFVDAENKWKSTCLWHSDLDNYFRLTCYKLTIGVQHSEPALESLFPTGAWPDSVSSKYSVPEN